MQSKKEFAILAIPIVALLVWAVVGLTQDRGSWQCSQVGCGRLITAQEWVDMNCYQLPQDNSQVVCTVNLNGTNQLVPLTMIDMSNLNQCLDPVCVQEVKVRKANYTITNLTGGV
jgi:hypothetical protein